MKGIIKVDDTNFEQTISSGIVLIDFYADWCGPCRMLTPILEALASEMDEQLIIAKLDVDNAPKTATNFQIASVPTLILFKQGKEFNRIIGLKDLEGLKKIVSQAL